MSVAIKVENLSKVYHLGEIGTGTLSRDVERWWALLRGKEDPFLKIGEANDRTSKGNSNVVYSLKDLSFEINQGDAVGIIGRNGAGKSTLLKILSRVTSPTTGKVSIKGRVASLLEVGTGFHPELTGRENIYLNGAILGMRKKEIDRKLDEIVDFSGIERYVDTPVKRYSSGMYVRLAFAVAAHLECEILVVDEVLAVGDAEFQKKCLGKMNDVSKGQGRTVLFVSHNMSAIQTLCNKGVVLSNGNLNFEGNIKESVEKYLNVYTKTTRLQEWPADKAPGNEDAQLLKVAVAPVGGSTETVITTNDVIELTFKFNVLNESRGVIDVTFHLRDELGQLVFVGSTALDLDSLEHKKGVLTVKAYIPSGFMHEGSYIVDKLLLIKDRGTGLYEQDEVLHFEIVDVGNEKMGWIGSKQGVVRPKLNWTINN